MQDLRIVQPRALLREQVLDKLRNAIIEGWYPPGTRLIERELCEALGVSRTSVREVLRQLETEQLITVEPRKGPTVATIGVVEANAIYETRIIFETAVVRAFVERATNAQCIALKGAAEAFAKAAATSEKSALLSSMGSFYDTLLDGAGNAVLQSVVRQLMARVAFLRSKSLSEPGRLKVSVEEIGQLCDAIVARDTRRAEDIARLHVSNARDAALRQLALEAKAK
ncbi:GntR family transcriptional regulator [Devosia sp. WQ 349]|uniref:GntR family transcriptional regulator n=1 Tax=Devosia sp. WQ 349K1 TaxID=2800329 RepID=UPI001905C4FB|nr:GntR family transcriptional regulator [Devosia sp. WQ 349K1]MBK1795499.1 GntR family transcriptional regulator [Devosia sp. WQ 349K1]